MGRSAGTRGQKDYPPWITLHVGCRILVSCAAILSQSPEASAAASSSGHSSTSVRQPCVACSCQARRQLRRNCDLLAALPRGSEAANPGLAAAARSRSDARSPRSQGLREPSFSRSSSATSLSATTGMHVVAVPALSAMIVLTPASRSNACSVAPGNVMQPAGTCSARFRSGPENTMGCDL